MHWDAAPSPRLSLAKQLKSSQSIMAPEHLLLLTELPRTLLVVKGLEPVPRKPELESAMSPFSLYSLVVFITLTSEHFPNAGERVLTILQVRSQ